MKCPTCGADIMDSWIFCPNCKRKITDPIVEKQIEYKQQAVAHEKTTNKVAKVFKVYAIINFIVCIIASIWISTEYYEVLFFIIGAAIALVVNFMLYAFGEVIQLLEDIKNNTKKAYPQPVSDNLPDL